MSDSICLDSARIDGSVAVLRRVRWLADDGWAEMAEVNGSCAPQAS